MANNGRDLRIVVVAGAVLLAAYLLLSLAGDPAGYLGTDTGGKVATLRVMDGDDTWIPAVGYWAEDDDPAGDLHPLYYTSRIGDRWVNVTTLPAIYAGFPLYRIGGYRAALLVPMLGAVAAAFAARALARRLRPGSPGWAAFWVAGLASPLAVYALDFWEHTWGVALMGWGTVFAFDLAVSDGDQPSRWRGTAARAGLAGALFGLAATMRTEAIVYGGVIVGLALAARLFRRRDRIRALLAVGAVGAIAAVGFLVPLGLNNALERAVLGQSLRADRAQAAVTGAPAAEGNRVEEALVTFFGLSPSARPASWLGGAIIGAAVVAVAAAGTQNGVWGRKTSPDDGSRPQTGLALATVLAAVAVALYAARALTGLGFVPGLVAATPLAAAALVGAGRLRDGPLLVAFALAPLPLVWAFQYTGGAIPQWGGRYILLTGFLLGVAGVVTIGTARSPVRTGLTAVAVAVTAFGVVWLAVRSHGVAGAGERLADRPEPLVFRVAHLAREEGARYNQQRRWLTAVEDGEDEQAATLLAGAGHPVVTFVDLDADARPLPEGWTALKTERLRFLTGVRLRLTMARAP